MNTCLILQKIHNHTSSRIYAATSHLNPIRSIYALTTSNIDSEDEATIKAPFSWRHYQIDSGFVPNILSLLKVYRLLAATIQQKRRASAWPIRFIFYLLSSFLILATYSISSGSRTCTYCQRIRLAPALTPEVISRPYICYMSVNPRSVQTLSMLCIFYWGIISREIACHNSDG